MSRPPFADDRPVPEPAVRLERVSVQYVVAPQQPGGLKEYAIRRLRGEPVERRRVSALSDVTFDVARGDIVGVVGRNGAGKSTLLKVIARVLRPTAGRVLVRGRVAPLLELGAGFHPELTGRENVLLNGTLLGHAKRDIIQRMDVILAFAEIDEFIDLPLRMYSSGMVARLGFAVATAWQPDILILDEILAVGDSAFQEKCVRRLHDICSAGATVFLVSHALDRLEKLCERAVWLDQGRLRRFGPVHDVADAYGREAI